MTRQVVSILTVILGVLVIVTGIGEAFRPQEQIPIHHIVVSSLFVIAMGTHAWLNRKPLASYFTRFGWNWAWLTGAIVVIAVLAAFLI